MIQQAMSVNQANPPDSEVLDRREIVQIVTDLGRDRGGLIAILEEIQNRYGYLSEKALRMVSAQTGRSLVDVYGIATFYRAFSLVPRGKHLVCACLGTACHVRGAPRVVDELERQLGIRAGQTTPDGEFTLETVNCLGACALGPVIVIDGRYFSKVGRSRVRQLLEQASAGFEKTGPGGDEGFFPVDVSCPRCNRSLMDDTFPIDGRPSIRCSISFDQRHGWLRLSSVYGSNEVEAECEVSSGTTVNFYCPHCHNRLVSHSTCSECAAPMVTVMVNGGGVLQICSRRGCENRMLDLV